jgi:hypothetical protein
VDCQSGSAGASVGAGASASVGVARWLLVHCWRSLASLPLALVMSAYCKIALVWRWRSAGALKRRLWRRLLVGVASVGAPRRCWSAGAGVGPLDA